MPTQQGQGPWWAALTVWAVVNAVSTLQSIGILSRIRTGSMTPNHRLGYVMIALAAPALLSLVAFVRSQAGILAYLDPVVYLCFVAILLIASMLAAVRDGAG